MVAGSGARFVATTEDWLTSPVLERLVARVAFRYRLSVDDLPDLVQDTRIALWGNGLDRVVNATFVLRIAENKVIDCIRRRMRRRIRERAADNAFTPRNDGELRCLLNVSVEGLPAHLHDLYELHYRQGFSEREVATALGLCRASVRWLDQKLRRAIAGHNSSAEAGIRKADRIGMAHTRPR